MSAAVRGSASVDLHSPSAVLPHRFPVRVRTTGPLTPAGALWMEIAVIGPERPSTVTKNWTPALVSVRHAVPAAVVTTPGTSCGPESLAVNAACPSAARVVTSRTRIETRCGNHRFMTGPPGKKGMGLVCTLHGVDG